MKKHEILSPQTRALLFDPPADPMFQGTPRAALTAEGPITLTPGFAGNLAKETQSLQEKVHDFSIYPVVEFTLGWRF